MRRQSMQRLTWPKLCWLLPCEQDVLNKRSLTLPLHGGAETSEWAIEVTAPGSLLLQTCFQAHDWPTSFSVHCLKVIVTSTPVDTWQIPMSVGTRVMCLKKKRSWGCSWGYSWHCTYMDEWMNEWIPLLSLHVYIQLNLLSLIEEKLICWLNTHIPTHWNRIRLKYDKYGAIKRTR